MPLMSLRGYAAHRGVSLSTVQLAIKSGRIKRDRNGKIDSEKADATWDARTKGRERDAIGERLQQARVARETLNAKLAELDYRKRAGELVEVNEVRKVAFARGRALRDLISAIPERLGPVVAGLNDPLECIRALESECNRILDEMARPIAFGEQDAE